MYKEEELDVIKTPYWHKFSDRIDSISKAIITGNKIPLQRIAFYLTTNCNVNCEKCTVVDKFPSSTASLEFVIDTVTQGKKMGLEVVHLTGGEVTTIKNLDEYIREIRKLDIDVTMTTNGLASNSIAEKLIEAGISQIFLTIDPLDPVEKGAINRRTKAIGFAKTLIKNKTSGNFSLFIYSLLMNRTLDNFPKHVDELYEKLYPGIDGIYPIMIKHFPQVINLVLNKEDLEKYKNEIIPKIYSVLTKYYSPDTVAKTSTFLLSQSIIGYTTAELDLYSKGIFPGKLAAPCYISASQITVGSTGCVFRCLTHHRNTNQPILGNLKNESLASIINNNLDLNIFLKNVPLIPECMTICNPGYGFFNYQLYDKLKIANCKSYLPNDKSFSDEAVKKINELNCIDSAIAFLETRNANWALKKLK